MPDIKFRTDGIKTIKKAVGKTIKTADRTLRTVCEIKNTSVVTDELSDYSEDLGATVQSAESATAAASVRTGSDAICKSSAKALRVKKNVSSVKQSVKTAKTAFTNLQKTVGDGAKAVYSSTKAAKSTIKVAKTAEKEARTAKVTIKAAKTVAKTTARAAKVTVKATYRAVKATAFVLAKLGASVISALAAGGWVVLAVLLSVTVIAVVTSSALGILFSNTSSTNSLMSARAVLNSEFQTAVATERASLCGYEKTVVRPAPTITEWSDITAVYSVLAQRSGLAAAELNDEATELLRQTLWDMVSFSSSEETILSEETTDDGSAVEITETWGVLNVNYMTLDEAAAYYGFSIDETSLLYAVEEAQTDLNYGIVSLGGGTLINPCPDGVFNGNDYPAYAGSGEYHAGRDISCAVGTNVYASGTGTVIHINDQAASYGNHIMIDHGGEIYTLYAHLSEILVSVGDTVEQGQLIALSGATGNVTGPHLHFELRVGGSKFRINNVDPLEWIG